MSVTRGLDLYLCSQDGSNSALSSIVKEVLHKCKYSNQCNTVISIIHNFWGFFTFRMNGKKYGWER